MTATDRTKLTAVVTGASGAIGRAIAKQLSLHNVHVWATGRNASTLAELAAWATKSATPIVAFPADLANEDDLGALGDMAANELDGLDLLVHAAGHLAIGDIAATDVQVLDEHYRVNVRAPYVLTRAFLPLLKRRAGQVIFVNSSVVTNPRAGLSHYAATKAALRTLADTLRQEVNADGIRVTTVYPGRTASAMQEKLWEPGTYRPELFSRPEDVATAVVSAWQLPRSTEMLEMWLRPTHKNSVLAPEAAARDRGGLE